MSMKIEEDNEYITKAVIEQGYKTIEITRWKKAKQIELFITEKGEKRNKFCTFALKDGELKDFIKFIG